MSRLISKSDEQILKQSRELIRVGDEVKKVVDSPGWNEILEPMLNKMIVDVLGGMENGRWHNGSLDRAKREERKEFLLGYKAGLINFHSAVYSYLDELESAHKTIKELEESLNERFAVPMTTGEYAGGQEDDEIG